MSHFSFYRISLLQFFWPGVKTAQHFGHFISVNDTRCVSFGGMSPTSQSVFTPLTVPDVYWQFVPTDCCVISHVLVRP
jgi:hypothetical protein